MSGVIAFLSNPKRFTPISLVFLLIMLALEVLGIQIIAQALPSQVDALDARAMLQSLIAFDGVFFGFSAIVFSSLVSRESSFQRISYIFSAMFATVVLFVLSVVFAFSALASVSSGGMPAGAFANPLGFSVYGISVFFFMVWVHVMKSKQAFK